MIQYRRWRSVMFLFVTVMTAGGASTFGNAQDRDFAELLAIQQNNREKMVYFDDGQDEACPQWTSLIYGAGNKFEMIVPSFALLGLRGSTTAGAGGSGGTHSKDVVFWNEHCKYRISVKKLVVRYGTEVEVPLYSGNRQSLEEPKRQDPTVPLTPERPPRPEQNKIVREYPDRSGFVQFRVGFESINSKTEFSGLFYLAPRNMTVYLVNAAKDLHLESRKNHSTKSYEMDIKSPEASIRLSVAKEIFRNDSWIQVFGE